MREASNDLTYQVMIKCLWPIQYSDLIIGLRSANESNAVCHGLGANLESYVTSHSNHFTTLSNWSPYIAIAKSQQHNSESGDEKKLCIVENIW